MLNKADKNSHAGNTDLVAVVVGGSSGIGFNTALGLCREGYTVYNLSRRAAEFCRLCVPALHNIPCDVESDCDVGAAIGAIAAKEGRVDALIYSAGVSLAAPLEYTSEKDFRRIFEVNYFGFIKALWQVLPVMRERREGRIVVVSSLAGQIPVPFDAPYSASKAALDITLRTLAIELKPYNIKLTSIAPGGVATNFTFKRKIYQPCQTGEYCNALDKAVCKLAGIEQNGLDPYDVAENIIDLLKTKRPPQSCSVGLGNKTARLAQKVLPNILADRINARIYDQ